MSANSPRLLDGRVALLVTNTAPRPEATAHDEISIGIAEALRQAGAIVDVLDVAGASPEEIQALVAQRVASVARLDILVGHLLGSPRPQPLETTDPQTTLIALQTVAATHAAMRAAFASLRDSRRGRILLIGHRHGESINESIGPYNAAAWGLVGLARTAAVDWGQYQITTNVLIPLARTGELEAAAARRPQIIDRLTRQLPLRRAGDPTNDIGAAATIFASDLMRFVNGEIVHVDGGQQVAGPLFNPARF